MSQNERLVDFVRNLHAIHSDICGFNINGSYVEQAENTARIRRWMDAVLPPVEAKPWDELADIFDKSREAAE